MNGHSAFPDIRRAPSIGPDDADRVRGLFERSVPFELQDDRFDQWPSPSSAGRTVEQPSALATVGGRLVGYLGGPVEQGTAELDAIVEPDVEDPAQILDRLFGDLSDDLRAAGATATQIWGRPSQPWHASMAEQRGGSQTRALHQMRCRLPVGINAIGSRAYRPQDLQALREVNNRAFRSHPDQGHQTDDSLLATMAQAWFRPDGLRIHERDGRVAGFCWTKIHPSRCRSTDPGTRSEPLGEIYVIGIDPDFHGRGMGAPMTAAGLEWLHEQGLSTAMLYVEADNMPAVRTYERLGFTIVRTDRAWSIPIDRP